MTTYWQHYDGQEYNSICLYAVIEKPLELTSEEQYISFLHVVDVGDASNANHVVQSAAYAVGISPTRLKDAIALYLKINPQKAPRLWGEMPYRPTQIMNP